LPGRPIQLMSVRVATLAGVEWTARAMARPIFTRSPASTPVARAPRAARLSRWQSVIWLADAAAR
jgi:hypothetical protein